MLDKPNHTPNKHLWIFLSILILLLLFLSFEVWYLISEQVKLVEHVKMLQLQVDQLQFAIHSQKPSNFTSTTSLISLFKQQTVYIIVSRTFEAISHTIIAWITK